MRSIKKELFFIAIFSLVMCLVYFFRVGGENYNLIAKILNYMAIIVALFFGFQSLKYFGIKNNQGKITGFIIVTLILWFIGDIAWDLAGDTVVSLADIPYFIGYAFLAVGIISGILLIDPNFFRKKLIMLSIIYLILMVAYFKFFPFSWDSEISLLENIGTAGYLFADFIMLILVVTILILLISGSYSHSWLSIASASFISFISDIFYTVNYDTYESGSIIDLGWLLGYILYAMFFIFQKYNAQKIIESVKSKSLPHKK